MQASRYVPVLKWRQGEYQALMRLSSEAKEFVVPLIELCPPEFDFETQTMKKTIDQQLSTFANRLKAKWGDRWVFVDGLHLDRQDRMENGRHPMGYIMGEVRKAKCNAIPVTGLDRDADYQRAVKGAIAESKSGVCVRLTLDDATEEDIQDQLDDLFATLDVSVGEVDLFIDLKAANFTPVASLAAVINAAIGSCDYFEEARSLTIAGSSFPSSMGAFKKQLTEIDRSEWLLYKELISQLPIGKPRPWFGDYAIAAPDLVSLDMRVLKPAASVRYAINDAWIVVKGSNVRDNGFGQYQSLCQDVVNFKKYLGPGFSKGSEYIAKCGAGSESTGNLTTWRWVGTNHHMTKVVSDLSSFVGL